MPLNLFSRAARSGAAFLPIVAVVAVIGSNNAQARSTEILIRTLATHEEGMAEGGSPASAPAIVLEAVPVSHVTFGRATDLVGRPVNYLRPIRTSVDLASLAKLPGLLPSRMPVAAYSMTSGFGMRAHPLLGIVREHSGVDLAAPLGSPIYATSDGIVSMANWRGGYGLFVSLDHGAGVQTRYGHMSQLNVVAGQQVRKGDVIGRVGSTGLSTGPHLHYEVRLNGQAVNPVTYLKQR